MGGNHLTEAETHPGITSFALFSIFVVWSQNQLTEQRGGGVERVVLFTCVSVYRFISEHTEAVRATESDMEDKVGQKGDPGVELGQAQHNVTDCEDNDFTTWRFTFLNSKECGSILMFVTFRPSSSTALKQTDSKL